MGVCASTAETIARTSCSKSTGGASPKPPAGQFGHFRVARMGGQRTLSNRFGRAERSSAGADTGQPNLALRTILLDRQRSQLATAGLQTAAQGARQPESGLPGLSGESPRTSLAPGPAAATRMGSPNVRWVTTFKSLLQAQFERYGDSENDAVRKQCHSSYESVVAKVREAYRNVFLGAADADVIDPIAAYSAIWELRNEMIFGQLFRLPLQAVTRYLTNIENHTDRALAQVTRLTGSSPAMPTAPPSQSGTEPCPGAEASTPGSIHDSARGKGHDPYRIPRMWVPKQERWKQNFLELQKLEEQCRKRGDDNNAKACRKAIDAIESKIRCKHDNVQGVPGGSPAGTEEALDALCALVKKAYSTTGPMSFQTRGLCVSLARIYSSTERMVDELSRSTRAFEPATAPGAACAGRSGPIATGSEVAGTNAGSQQKQSGETQPGPIAGRLAHQVPARPDDFNWRTAFEVLHRDLRQCGYTTDPYAGIPCRDAIREIDAVVRCALDHLDGERQVLSGGDKRTETAYQALCGIRDESGQLPSSQERAAEAGRALQAIDDLTCRKTMELSMRAQDFAAFPAARASTGGAPPLFEPRKLAGWLQGQARRAQGDVERSSGLEKAGAMLERDYFQCLHQEHDKGCDPWTISRQLLLNLDETTRATAAKSLEIAHTRLVEAMADPNLKPAEPSASKVARVAATALDPLRTDVPTSAPVAPPGPQSGGDPDFSDIGNLFEDLAGTVAM